MSLLTGAGGSTAVPSSRFAALRAYVDRALQRIWEGEQWPDLCRAEERNYRLPWASGTTYSASTSTAPVEVWFAPSQKYYQSLVGSNSNNAPATQSGSTWTENSSKWAESKSDYSGANWAASTVYSVGTIVRRTSGSTADYLYYQCHTAHTSGATFDTTKFCVLTPFDQYVAFEQTGETAIGECFAVFDRNPRLSRGWREYAFQISENGIQVPEGPATVWLELRTRRSVLTGDAYSATATYAAGDQVYYTASGVGDFYACVSATTAGESPVSAAAKWAIVEIPYIFKQYLVWSAYADLLASDGQVDKAQAAGQSADQYWQMEADKLYRQQSQTRPRHVVGY